MPSVLRAMRRAKRLVFSCTVTPEMGCLQGLIYELAFSSQTSRPCVCYRVGLEREVGTPPLYFGVGKHKKNML